MFVKTCQALFTSETIHIQLQNLKRQRKCYWGEGGGEDLDRNLDENFYSVKQNFILNGECKI